MMPEEDGVLDEEGRRNLAGQVHEYWITPEVARRRTEGTLADDFRIYRCLIRLPRDSAPIVEFNNEVHWVARTKPPNDVMLTEGDTIHLHQIEEIISADPPKVDGKRVAFVFLYWTGLDYQWLFDFTPNWDEGELPEGADEWKFGELIASHLQAIITEKVLQTYDAVQEKLRRIGLWAAPALLPYPLSKIIVQLDAGNEDDARRTLVAHCTPIYIKELIAKWWKQTSFELRRNLIEEALHAHEIGAYHSSIHTLLPHAEGIISDWEHALNDAREPIPFRTEKKAKKFRDMALGDVPVTYTYRRIVESTSSFVLDGPVLKTFKKWMDDLDTAFPNRHAVEHGRYDERFFTEENSIKVFLLLDTICHIISAHKPAAKH